MTRYLPRSLVLVLCALPAACGASASSTGGGTGGVGGISTGTGGAGPTGTGGTTPPVMGSGGAVGSGGTTPNGKGGTPPLGTGGTLPAGTGGMPPVGGAAGAAGSVGGGGGGAAGSAAGAAGSSGAAGGGGAGGGGSGGTALTGTLGTLGMVKPTVNALWVSNSGETLIYLSSAPLTCMMMQTMGVGWLNKVAAGSQVIEIVVKGAPAVKTYPVAFLQGEVNYAPGGMSSSYETVASSGSITITKAMPPGNPIEGTIMATYPMGSVMGTFHAEYCANGSQY